MKEGKLTMCCVTGGIFIVGRLFNRKLDKPRVFSIIENGAKIQLAPLPGTPDFLILGTDGFHYPIHEREKNLIDLYEKVTHPPEEVPNKNVVNMVSSPGNA